MKADVAQGGMGTLSQNRGSPYQQHRGGGLQDTEGHDPGENVCLLCGSSH